MLIQFLFCSNVAIYPLFKVCLINYAIISLDDNDKRSLDSITIKNCYLPATFQEKYFDLWGSIIFIRNFVQMQRISLSLI